MTAMPTRPGLFLAVCALLLCALLPPAKAKGQVVTWWSLRPLVQPAVPPVREFAWPRSPIDAFVLAKLDSLGLQPSPQADRATLIRRATFDLIGLPRTRADIEEVVRDPRTHGYEGLADRLRAAAAYGDLWAQHVSAVVNQGETHGYDRDKPRLNAWPCG